MSHYFLYRLIEDTNLNLKLTLKLFQSCCNISIDLKYTVLLIYFNWLNMRICRLKMVAFLIFVN